MGKTHQIIVQKLLVWVNILETNQKITYTYKVAHFGEDDALPSLILAHLKLYIFFLVLSFLLFHAPKPLYGASSSKHLHKQKSTFPLLYFSVSSQITYACSSGTFHFRGFCSCGHQSTHCRLTSNNFLMHQKKKRCFILPVHSLMETTRMSWKLTCWRQTVMCWTPHLLPTAQSDPKHWQ